MHTSVPIRCVWLFLIFRFFSSWYPSFSKPQFCFLTMCLRQQASYSLGKSYPRICIFICHYFLHPYFIFIDLFCWVFISRDVILTVKRTAQMGSRKRPTFLHCWLENILFSRQLLVSEAEAFLSDQFFTLRILTFPYFSHQYRWK